MKKLAILTVMIVGTSTAAFAYPSYTPTNESFVAQIGYENGAIVSQKNGHNTQASLQVGARNFALTSQVANPSRHGPSGTNGSLTVQFGAGNTALTGQEASNGNSNVAATLQVGDGNFALTSQNSRNVQNTAVTAQFGARNWAVTSQH